MNPIGALLGALVGVGVCLIVSAVRSSRLSLIRRVGSYLINVDEARVVSGERGFVATVLSSTYDLLSKLLENLGSTNASVRRRLRLANLGWTLRHMRIVQLVSAAIGLQVGVIALALLGLGGSGRWVLGGAVLALCAAAGLLGPDYWLTQAAKRRQRAIEYQTPDCAELLALSVAAGEGVVPALGRVAGAVGGPLAEEVRRAVAAINSGTSVARALSQLQSQNASPALERLCEALLTALERGSPLGEVLRSQSKDAREAQRRALIEEGGRREIAMLVPVVFLILPITVLFALYPGLMSLKFHF